MAAIVSGSNFEVKVFIQSSSLFNKTLLILLSRFDGALQGSTDRRIVLICPRELAGPITLTLALGFMLSSEGILTAAV
jgi:hypothetical protein